MQSWWVSNLGLRWIKSSLLPAHPPLHRSLMGRMLWNTSQWQRCPKYSPSPRRTRIRWWELGSKTSTTDTAGSWTSSDGRGGTDLPAPVDWTRLPFHAHYLPPPAETKELRASTKASSQIWSASRRPAASLLWFMRTCPASFWGQNERDREDPAWTATRGVKLRLKRWSEEGSVFSPQRLSLSTWRCVEVRGKKVEASNQLTHFRSNILEADWGHWSKRILTLISELWLFFLRILENNFS